MVKKLLLVVGVLVVAAAAVVAYMWNKPHPKVEDAKTITIAAGVLAKEYSSDEKIADSKYLSKNHDRAIEVTGTVSEIDTNQDGGLMVILSTDDPMAGIQCAMREKNVSVAKASIVTIKGYCSGNGITGVSLTDCIMK